MKKILLFVLFLVPTIVLNAQVATQPPNLEICDDDGDGFGTFDLTTNSDVISGGDPTFVVYYFENMSDVDDNANSIDAPSFYNNITNPQTIFAKLEDPNTGNFDTTDFSLMVQPSPIVPSEIDDFTISEVPFDGFATFDLTSRVDEILNGEDPSMFDISFFLTQVEAESMIDAISNPESYVNIANFQEIFVGVLNVNTFCYTSSLSFNLVVLEGSTINMEPEDIFINEGDDNGLAIFDLTLNESQMLGDQDPTIFLFSYHTTLDDAEDGVNMIANPEAYQNIENPQTIYVRLTNSNSGGFALTSFEIETDGVLSIEESLLSNFTIYPVPSSDIITIPSLNLSDKLLGSIIDSNGREVLNFDIILSSEDTLIPISNLSSGIYFIRLFSDDINVVRKFIKK